MNKAKEVATPHQASIGAREPPLLGEEPIPAKRATSPPPGPPPGPPVSLVNKAGHLLKRGYERVCSAIFDPDDDCMRF